MVQAGQYVTDGTAVFLVTDIRDGAQVGDIKLAPILHRGYVQANGALLSQASVNYPRLVTLVTENPSLKATDDTAWASNKALYVYDSANDTLRVPDATGRVLQGSSTIESREAGLPNIIGSTGGLGAEADTTGLMYQISTGTPSQTSYSNGALTVMAFSATMKGKGMSTVTASNRSVGNQIALNASQSNAIYGSSTTVQPPALTCIPQIKY